MSIPIAVPAPPGPRGFQGKGGRYRQNLQKYGTPLPLLLPSSPLHPAYPSTSGGVVDPATLKEPERGWLASAGLGRQTDVVVPAVVGVLDKDTGSVWVEGEGMEVLFNRGFFGKGTLSRSDPSWRKRRMEQVRGGDAFLAEQVREKRRVERKQFKIDRAAAMLDAAKKAEAVLTTGQLRGQAAADEEDDNNDEGEDGEGERPASPTGSTMSLATNASTAILPDGTKLNAQTFLVRPERPASAGNNRNRGKFKRRPPPNTAANSSTTSAEATASTTPAAPPPASASAPAPAPPTKEEKADDEDDMALELVPEMEHLQLTLEEAYFLTSLGVLKLLDANGTLIPTSAVLTRLLTPLSPELPTPNALYPDDPLLVNYAAYHHYRSLGWCVRHGIKFCVDWLLYRRGPVFSHSAFSILLIPVYMDDEDQKKSPYGETDWYKEKQAWKWINTVMRVNSLVQKTVILAYVTIPSMSSFPDSARLEGGGLDPRKFDMRSLMSRYTVREVSLTRFSAARRRD